MPNRGMWVLVWVLLGLAPIVRAGDGPPVVFWTSDPSRPGDTVMMYGAGLAGATGIRLARVEDGAAEGPANTPFALPDSAQVLRPVQPCDHSVKFFLPDNLKAGVFAVQVETPQGRSAVGVLNRPQPWWCQGDAGVTATPGGWVRVFGRCMGEANAHTTMLMKGPKTATLTAHADCYAAKAEMPKDIPPGEYEVLVHNGFGGKWGWSAALKVTIAPREAWPATVFNVKDIGAKGDALADDTAAVAQALQKAKANGGGVVYFPRGGYKLSATLAVPPKTVLRGEREDLVHIFWTQKWKERLDAVIIGTNRFGLEDLSLTFVGANNGILGNVPCRGAALPPKMQPTGAEAGDIFLRRVRVRWLLYADHIKIVEANQIFTETAKDGGYGATGYLLFFGGRNIEITDCDLYSSGNAFDLLAVKGALIARNRLTIGRDGWANFCGCDGVICEDNAFPGGDNMVRSGVTFWSRAPIRNTYFARNTLDHVYSSDREGMTTDGASGKYFGPVASATPTTVTVPPGTPWKPDELVDHTCFILGGTGQGQWRTVTKNTDTAFTLDRPWDVPPAADSIIGVNHQLAHLLIIGNTMSDLGIAFQFYGTAMECVVAENRCARSGGFFSHAARYPGGSKFEKDTQPQFFVQYLDNEIVEGNTPYSIRGYDYGMGQSVLGVQGFPGGAGKLEWRWPMALGFVIRGNKLDSNAKIVVRGAGGIEKPAAEAAKAPLVQDVIIERNTVSYADVGVDLGPRCGGVVVRKNAFDRVAKPLTGPGLPAALLEK